EEEDSFLYALQLATAPVFPTVLKSAIDLDLLELIKKSGAGAFVSPAELAAQIPATYADAPAVLDRVLRVLACHDVLRCQVKALADGGIERRYGLAPVCKFLTKNEEGVSLVPLMDLNRDKVVMDSWHGLKDAILDGSIAFNKIHGMTVFEYFSTDARYCKLFNAAMFSHSSVTMNKLLNKYRGFENVSTVVDVGGGIGAALNMIVSKHPRIRGINFDMPRVIEHAPSYPGVEHIGGDMFESVPKGDAILLKWILHDWSDEDCNRILKKCCEAIPESGKVMVAEYILPNTPDNSSATRNVVNMDAIMLARSPSGKERTEEEFRTLGLASGFKHFKKVCSAYNLLWVMELTK
ncbi:hypothetical protein M569_09791, partial [Genlisea aurea]